MTPEEAQGLLDGATPGPWQVRGDGPANRQLHVCDCEERAEVAESVTWENAPLIAAAPALAELVASLRYEYDYELLLGDEWVPMGHEFATLGDACEAVSGSRRTGPARIVRRLAGEPEVVE